MNINVQFSNEEVTTLIEMYLDRLKSKKEKVSLLEKEIKEINAKIIQLKKAQILDERNGEINPITNDNLYSDKWQWVKKIKYAITINNKAITVNEIVEILADYEPAILLDKRKAMSTLSGTLSSKSGTYEDKKEFIRLISDSGEYAYDLWKEKVEEKEENYGNTIIVDDLPF